MTELEELQQLGALVELQKAKIEKQRTEWKLLITNNFYLKYIDQYQHIRFNS